MFSINIMNKCNICWGVSGELFNSCDCHILIHIDCLNKWREIKRKKRKNPNICEVCLGSYNFPNYKILSVLIKSDIQIPIPMAIENIIIQRNIPINNRIARNTYFLHIVENKNKIIICTCCFICIDTILILIMNYQCDDNSPCERTFGYLVYWLSVFCMVMPTLLLYLKYRSDCNRLCFG